MKTLFMKNEERNNAYTSRLIENMFRIILIQILNAYILNKETFDVLF